MGVGIIIMNMGMRRMPWSRGKRTRHHHRNTGMRCTSTITMNMEPEGHCHEHEGRGTITNMGRRPMFMVHMKKLVITRTWGRGPLSLCVVGTTMDMRKATTMSTETPVPRPRNYADICAIIKPSELQRPREGRASMFVPDRGQAESRLTVCPSTRFVSTKVSHPIPSWTIIGVWRW